MDVSGQSHVFPPSIGEWKVRASLCTQFKRSGTASSGSDVFSRCLQSNGLETSCDEGEKVVSRLSQGAERIS